MKIRVSIVTSTRCGLPVKRYRRPPSLAELQLTVQRAPVPGLSLEIGLWRTRYPAREPINWELNEQLVDAMKIAAKILNPKRPQKVRGVVSTALSKFKVHLRVCDGSGTPSEIALAKYARLAIVKHLTKNLKITGVEMLDDDGGIVKS